MKYDWSYHNAPMILRTIPHMPLKTIAEMYRVSHKWLKKWLRQNYPQVKWSNKKWNSKI
jgi:hypothetical protein